MSFTYIIKYLQWALPEYGRRVTCLVWTDFKSFV